MLVAGVVNRMIGAKVIPTSKSVNVGAANTETMKVLLARDPTLTEKMNLATFRSTWTEKLRLSPCILVGKRGAGQLGISTF